MGVYVVRMMIYCFFCCGGYIRFSGIWGEMFVFFRFCWSFEFWGLSFGLDFGEVIEWGFFGFVFGSKMVMFKGI